MNIAPISLSGELAMRNTGHLTLYMRPANLLTRFFFDNSVDGRDSVMFAHFKIEKGKKKWDSLDAKIVPGWFKKYYSDKVTK